MQDRPLAVPERAPVGTRERRASSPNGQPDHRRRGRGPWLVQQAGKLEHIGDLLPDTRPITIQNHRQRELVNPRRTPSPCRTHAQEPDDPRDREIEQEETRVDRIETTSQETPGPLPPP